VHWCETRGLAARPLHMIGYGEEDDAGEVAAEPAPEDGA
jgi:putative mRNA 3-end processing factor